MDYFYFSVRWRCQVWSFSNLKARPVSWFWRGRRCEPVFGTSPPQFTLSRRSLSEDATSVHGKFVKLTRLAIRFIVPVCRSLRINPFRTTVPEDLIVALRAQHTVTSSGRN